jgi:hypothetical protein
MSSFYSQTIELCSLDILVHDVMLSPCDYNVACILYRIYYNNFEYVTNLGKERWICLDNLFISNDEIIAFLSIEIKTTIKNIIVDYNTTNKDLDVELDLILLQNYEILMNSLNDNRFISDVIVEARKLFNIEYNDL